MHKTFGVLCAAALVVAGLCLSISYWMAPTHTWNGINYADAFNFSMTAAAVLLAVLGAGLLIGSWVTRPQPAVYEASRSR